MKNFFLPAAVLSAMISCTDSVTKKETVENADGTVSTMTTTTQKTTAVDSAKVGLAVQNVKSGLDKAGSKLDSVAHIAGKKLDKAGEDLKDAAKKGATRVDDQAEKTKENLQKK